MLSPDTIRQNKLPAARLLDSIRALAVRGLRTLRKPSAARRLQLIETLSLGGKRQLLLVACDGRCFLLGAGPDAIGSITPLPTPASTDQSSSADVRPSDFTSVDGGFLQ